MGIGPDSYGPGKMDTGLYDMIAGLGPAYTKAADRTRKIDLEDQRREVLAGAGVGPDGSLDLASAGRALMSIGDLEGAAGIVKLLQAQNDGDWNKNLSVANLQLQQSADNRANRELGLRENTIGVPAGFERVAGGGLQPIKGGPEDPTHVGAKKDAGKDEKLDEVAKAQLGADMGRIKDFNADAETARDLAVSVANIRELRKGAVVSTPFGDYRPAGKPFAGLVAAGADMAGQGGPRALEAAATDFKLNLSSKLKGAISDKEQTMLSKATTGLNMSDPAADVVLELAEAGTVRKRERSAFAQAWFGRNKTLAGSDEAWDRYLEEKPLLASAGEGRLAINKANLNQWKRYIGDAPKEATPTTRGSKAGASSAAAAAPGAVEYAGDNDENLARLEGAPQKYVEGATYRSASTGKTYTVVNGRPVETKGAAPAPAAADEEE